MKKFITAIIAATAIAVVSVAGVSAAEPYTCNFGINGQWTDECQVNTLANTAESYEVQDNWAAANETWQRYQEVVARISGGSQVVQAGANEVIYINTNQPEPSYAPSNWNSDPVWVSPAPSTSEWSGSSSWGDATGGDKDCKDFSSHYEAQTFFITNGGLDHDSHRLDGDNDGIACESLR